ncbi:T9SS type A sorting domain-containing protein [candidate division KSB1 bacterium]|nr:T9SS type A sorting domain-containing protein [candidate division KSB1 bacterium]
MKLSKLRCHIALLLVIMLISHRLCAQCNFPPSTSWASGVINDVDRCSGIFDPHIAIDWIEGEWDKMDGLVFTLYFENPVDLLDPLDPTWAGGYIYLDPDFDEMTGFPLGYFNISCEVGGINQWVRLGADFCIDLTDIQGNNASVKEFVSYDPNDCIADADSVLPTASVKKISDLRWEIQLQDFKSLANYITGSTYYAIVLGGFDGNFHSANPGDPGTFTPAELVPETPDPMKEVGLIGHVAFVTTDFAGLKFNQEDISDSTEVQPIYLSIVNGVDIRSLWLKIYSNPNLFSTLDTSFARPVNRAQDYAPIVRFIDDTLHVEFIGNESLMISKGKGAILELRFDPAHFDSLHQDIKPTIPDITAADPVARDTNDSLISYMMFAPNKLLPINQETNAVDLSHRSDLKQGSIGLYAYPNPFNLRTVIRYNVPISGEVKITIFNIAGEVVKTLVSGWQAAGDYQIRWNGRNNFEQHVSSGVYICYMQAGAYSATQKLILSK